MHLTTKIAFAVLPAWWRALGALIMGLALCGPTLAQFVPITNFTKTNNIYTNLNEEFPHSGTGIPGSGVGTANASFTFDPATYTSGNSLTGSNAANNGVTFQITSDANGHDFTEINYGSPLVIPVGLQVSSVYLLMSAYNGTSFNVTFTGADNATETFNNVFLPDFNGGNGGAVLNQSAMVNGSLANNQFVQTVFRVTNVGAGGSGNSTTGAYNTYNLVEPTFILAPQLASEQLTSITIQSNGTMTLLLGATVAVPEPATIADVMGVAALSLVVWRKKRRQGQATEMA